MTTAAVFAAFLCVIAPWSVPIGAVPVSLATFAVYLAGLTLGKSGVVPVVCYIMLGLVGLPVFSGFGGGAGVLVGPTGGFLMGYAPGVLACGILADLVFSRVRGRIGQMIVCMAALIVSAFVIHACGLAWYMNLTSQTMAEAAAVCVLPFIVPECLKMLTASVCAAVLRERVVKAVPKSIH